MLFHSMISNLVTSNFGSKLNPRTQYHVLAELIVGKLISYRGIQILGLNI